MSVSAQQVEAGQAVYSKGTLQVYDWVMLGISNRFIWKCPTSALEAHYNKHLSANHLDVGVGTGYFLDRCRFPSATPRVALMDLNPEALAFTTRRIARCQPETYRRNVLEPIVIEAPRFDSVGINYLLHCIPGSIETKAVAFDHLKALMNPNAVLCGSTLLQGGVRRSGLAKRLMAVYNKKALARQHLGSLDKVTRVVRLTVSLVTTPEFRDHAKVADGASELLASVFGADKTSTRMVSGAASLPAGVSVVTEILLAVDQS